MIQSGEQLADGNCSSIQWMCLFFIIDDFSFFVIVDG